MCIYLFELVIEFSDRFLGELGDYRELLILVLGEKFPYRVLQRPNHAISLPRVKDNLFYSASLTALVSIFGLFLCCCCFFFTYIIIGLSIIIFVVLLVVRIL